MRVRRVTTDDVTVDVEVERDELEIEREDVEVLEATYGANGIEAEAEVETHGGSEDGSAEGDADDDEGGYEDLE